MFKGTVRRFGNKTLGQVITQIPNDISNSITKLTSQPHRRTNSPTTMLEARQVAEVKLDENVVFHQNQLIDRVLFLMKTCPQKLHSAPLNLVIVFMSIKQTNKYTDYINQ